MIEIKLKTPTEAAGVAVPIDKTTNDDPKDDYKFQYFTTFVATLLLLSSGLALGWPSPSIPKLLDPVNSPIPITLDDSSWIVSIIEIGVFLVGFPSVWLMDKYGRKPSLIVGTIPMIAAWIIFATANTAAWLYIARLLCGMSFGVGLCVTPMYLGEIASTKIRGTIGTLITVMMQSGLLLVYAIGPYIGFRTLAYVGLIPIGIFLLSSFWLPESPHYLISAGKQSEAVHLLEKLRGHKNVLTEFEQIKLAINESKLKSSDNSAISEIINHKGNRRAFIIVFGLSCIQILNGSLSIIAYTETIFHKIGGNAIKILGPSELTIVFGTIQLIFAVVATLVVDSMGRRPLFLISVVGTTICNGIVCGYFYLIRYDYSRDHISWLPVVAVMMFIVFQYLGLATALFPLLGEIFPAHLKRVGSACYTLVTSVLAFTVHKLFQVISDDAGSDVTFGIFTVFGIIFIPFVWIMVPETKGKTFDEILRELNK